jgi:geranylgeranyl diphosphate synthase type II
MRSAFDRRRAAVEVRLASYFTHDAPHTSLLEAMRYSLLAGGKRLRPILALAFCAACGGDEDAAMDAACALELLHTYSLIHDDLPCMDDDDLRRGKPTNHVIYGEWRAMLAGDALQAAAFEKLLGSKLAPEVVLQMARSLARAAGEDGICGGQTLDIEGEGKPLGVAELTDIHDRKTAALWIAAAEIGAIAGGGTAVQIAAAGRYARRVGLAFQVRDDLLDVTATTETLGKPQGSDAANNKSTFATQLGAERCEAVIALETAAAKAELSAEFADTAFLEWFADMLSERKN